MVDKYYTPSIDDFHVGFEYEAYNSREWFFREAEDGWIKMIWEPRLTSNNMQIGNIHAGIDKEWIRVKCLDAADVEECGWKIIIESDLSILFLKNQYSLTLGITEKSDRRLTGVVITEKRTDLAGCPEIAHFNGVIKNKSELKKIMKMTNIF